MVALYLSVPGQRAKIIKVGTRSSGYLGVLSISYKMNNLVQKKAIEVRMTVSSPIAEVVQPSL